MLISLFVSVLETGNVRVHCDIVLVVSFFWLDVVNYTFLDFKSFNILLLRDIPFCIDNFRYGHDTFFSIQSLVDIIY